MYPMKHSLMREFLLIAVVVVLSLTGFSQENLVGKPAPGIDIEQWIYPKIQVNDWQVKPIPADLTGRTIVLDFWFTRCAPCVASIPELNHLARKFPEVVYLSVTFDKPDEISRFLDKMVMYYPVGSDPDMKTIRAFGVTSYPETFLIDRNGIVKWQGSPFHLDQQLINKVLGADAGHASVQLGQSESPSEKQVYSFTAQKHHLDMGGSSYYHFNPFDINVFNKDLENMLQVFYGINRSRIISGDSAFLKTTYDVTLKADEEMTSQANCVEMLKYLLPGELGFEIREITMDTLVNVLQVTNDSLLVTHLTMSAGLGTTIRYDQWEAKGATLDNLRDFIEAQYDQLVTVNAKDDRKYDFVIPTIDFGKAVEILKDQYGLILIPQTRKERFWEVEKL